MVHSTNATTPVATEGRESPPPSPSDRKGCTLTTTTSLPAATTTTTVPLHHHHQQQQSQPQRHHTHDHQHRQTCKSLFFLSFRRARPASACSLPVSATPTASRRPSNSPLTPSRASAVAADSLDRAVSRVEESSAERSRRPSTSSRRDFASHAETWASPLASERAASVRDSVRAACSSAAEVTAR